MVDFSCALKLSMPLAVLSAMREAGGFHVTVKGGRYLEKTALADTVVFDKTGTLTHACPVVAEVVPFGGHDRTDMLRLAACLEEHFPHSMANAVAQAAREQGLSHEEMHSEVEYIVAHGIASEVNGRRVVIGSAHFVFEDERCVILDGDQARYDALPDQYSHLYLAISGVLSAVVCISDPLRQEAGQVIRSLRDLGIRRVVMLTGDSERTAAAIAAEFELVSLRRIADRLTGRIRSNYRFVIGFNGSLIALGALGVLAPATSAMLHNLSTLGVSLRSMTNLLVTDESGRAVVNKSKS